MRSGGAGRRGRSTGCAGRSGRRCSRPRRVGPPAALADPRRDLGGPPTTAHRRSGVERREQGADRLRGVAGDTDVDAVVRADRRRLVIDLDHRRPRVDEAAVPRRPHGEARADGEDRVRLGDERGGGGRGEAAGDPERPRRAGEEPVGDRRGREHRSEPVGERLAHRPCTGEHRSAAGEEERPPCRGEGGCRCRDRRRVGTHRDRARLGGIGRRARPPPPRGAGCRAASSAPPAAARRGRAGRAHGVGDRGVRTAEPLDRPRPPSATKTVLVDAEVGPDAAAAVSAARRTSGVRLFAASVRPVIALVSPGPWCTVQTPVSPLTRAYASAIVTAPGSWRAPTKVAPPATSARSPRSSRCR